MTLHVAAVYFDYDKKTCGFLLGSDRLGYNRKKEDVIGARQTIDREQPTLDDRILAEKSFRSPSTIGFCSGTFPWSKNEYEGLFRSFDGCFEDIGKRRDYNAHPTLMRAYDATLSIVKAGEDQIELYGVYKRRVKGKDPISVRRYMRLTRESFEDLRTTSYWTKLNIPQSPRRANAAGKQPLEHMRFLLDLTMRQEVRLRPFEVSLPFDFYAIDFDGIRKVA